MIDKPNRWKDQTILHTESTDGNCMQAAVASILDLPLEDVPHFAKYKCVETFWDLLEDFFNEKGFHMAWRTPDKGVPTWMHLACGPTERGNQHVVVKEGETLVHDPHPSRKGLLKTDYIIELIPFDPAQHYTNKVKPTVYR